MHTLDTNVDEHDLLVKTIFVHAAPSTTRAMRLQPWSDPNRQRLTIHALLQLVRVKRWPDPTRNGTVHGQDVAKSKLHRRREMDHSMAGRRESQLVRGHCTKKV